MVINTIGQYSVTLTMDVLQVAMTMQMLHMALNLGFDEDVAARLCLLGTEVEPDNVVLQLGQVVDSLARAIDMQPFEECTCGDKAGEGLIEEATTETEDAKPAKEPIN
jgi:hypothetical protein